MSYLVFARKYRPQTFDTVTGQEHVTRTLSNAILAGRVAHAVLFSGPRGTGKTTVARILAKAMNCINGPTPAPCNVCRSCTEITSGNSVDVLEIDGASNNGVENVRDLRDNVKYKPAYSKYKIYIIDEVHMLSTPAFNALLKTLEEPPSHVMFVFATTEPHKIPVTILSRCQRHDFKRISLDLITGQMASICGKEDVAVSEESLLLIARAAGGSMRDALSLLDLVLSCSDGPANDENLRNILGIVDRRIIFKISEAILRSDINVLLDSLDDLYEKGHNIKELYSDILEHFRDLLVVKIDKNVNKLVNLPSHEIDLMKEQVKDVPSTFLNQVFDLLYREEPAVRFSPNPKLSLEMVFFSMFQIKPALPIDLLIEKIDGLRQKIPVKRRNKISEAGTVYGSDANEYLKTEISEKAVDPYKNGGYEAGAKEPQMANNLEESNDFIKTWERLFAIISEKHPSLAANMTKCSIRTIAGNRLEIEVDGNGFNLSRIKNSKNIEILKNVCREFFGKKIEIVFEEKKTAEGKKAPKKNESNQLINDALNNPLVTDAVELFQGRVLDAKIL
ncbi:MAG: DNA polymerase III subunit gamma/tau [Desulfobacteraceae bacterium]|nr:MAG: DNA polymerase III subunit gamma/tau [Desulfobacteraceae bacterium]